MTRLEDDENLIKKNKISRKAFIKGAGAGAAVEAVAVVGTEEGFRTPGMEVYLG